MHISNIEYISLSTLALMVPPVLWNFLIKLTMQSRRPCRGLFLHMHIILRMCILSGIKTWFRFLQQSTISCKLRSRKPKSSQRLSLFHRVPPEDRSKARLAASCIIRSAQAAFCTVCCWYGETTRQDPPPITHHPQTGFYFERETFLKWVTKKLQDESFWHPTLTAREPLLHNEENGTRSKSYVSTAPPSPQLNRSLLVYRVSPQMQRTATGGRSRSSEYSPRAASSHFLSHELLFPVRLTGSLKDPAAHQPPIYPSVHLSCISIIHTSIHPLSFPFVVVVYPNMYDINTNVLFHTSVITSIHQP